MPITLTALPPLSAYSVTASISITETKTVSVSITGLREAHPAEDKSGRKALSFNTKANMVNVLRLSQPPF